jgi:hypothetical protein
MQREFTYQLPYGQLAKIYRSAGRKAFPDVWLLSLVLVILMPPAGFLAVLYGAELSSLMLPADWPPMPELPLLILLLFLAWGIAAIRRLRAKRVRERVDFDCPISFSKDEGGLRFNSDVLDNYVKWKGISQFLPEPGGVVISHGAAFLFIPNEAFGDAAGRRAFIEEVYGRLSEKARARSEKYVRAALAA